MDIKNKFRSVILFGLASLVGGHFLSAISGSSTLIPVHEDENGRNRAFFWSCVDSESELPGCTICLGEFSDEDHVTYLNGCFHVFCRDCIANWFASKGENVCPLCKQICSEEDVINNFTYEEVVDSEKIFFGENLDAQDGEESSTDQEEVVPVKSRLQQDIEDGAERVLVGSYWKRVAREIEDL
ncbi:hypothetical protein KAT92_01090, partial [Candidatus Babeliales bacterium]|nr:hypothetical protein [Candidatus Babeliales bacterium]